MPDEYVDWKASDFLVDFLKDVEGEELSPYNDSTGNITIGVGHKLTNQEVRSGVINIGGEKIHWKVGLTPQQSTQLLLQDLNKFVDLVNECCGPNLETQDQFDALVAFGFNIGSGAFQKSTLLRKVREGDLESVPSELRKWVKGRIGGRKVVLRGLVVRREKEISLWNGELTA